MNVLEDLKNWEGDGFRRFCKTLTLEFKLKFRAELEMKGEREA